MDRDFGGKWKLGGAFNAIELKRYRFDSQPLLLRTTGTANTAETLTVTASGGGIVLRARNGAFVEPQAVRTSWSRVLGATPGNAPFEFGVGEDDRGFVFLSSPFGKEFTCWGRSPGRAFLMNSMISSAMMNRRYTAAQLEAGEVRPVDRWRRDIVTPNMTTILQTKELPGVDLAGVDLSDADLSGKNLSRAQFAGADLTGTRFEGATLDGADFTQARLDGADFTGASLRSVKFDQTDLRRVRFSPTPAFGTDPEHCTSFVKATVPLGTLNKRFAYLNLTEVTLDGLSPGLDLGGLDARYCIAPDIGLSGTNLSKACFDHAHLCRADFSGSTLDAASFRGADVNLSIFASCTAPCAIFDNSELHQVNFTGANLEDTSFDGALLGASELAVNADFTDADLTRAVFTNAHLFGVTFSHVLACDVVFSGAQADRARFVRAYLTRAAFGGADLRGADFGAACLLDADFRSAMLSPASNVRTSFAGACLQGAEFDGAALNGASFKGAGLSPEPGKFPVTLPGPDGSRTTEVPHRTSSLPGGETGHDNVCPDGSNGPCNAPSWDTPDAPKAWRYDRDAACRNDE